MRKRALGLSLLEMLVTLLVAGMALLLLTQAIGQYHRAQSSVLHFERAGREYRLSEAWWRASVEGLQAIEDAPFVGDAEGFSGITLSPVLANQGTQTAQSWQVVFADDGGWGLALHENDRSITLPINQAENLGFRYLGQDGEWHSQWPPELGEHPTLPAAVSLQMASDGSPGELRTMVAAVVGAKHPVHMQYERGDL